MKQNEKEQQKIWIVDALENLATQMKIIGNEMRRFGGETAEHGIELIGAANIAANWAKNVGKEVTRW